MKTKLFVIAIMLVILVTCLCLPVFAFADTTNDIVNFNQYIKIESATNPANTFTDNSITVGENILSRVNVTPFSLLSNHKYYLKSNVISETMFYLGNGYSQYYGFYTRIITSGTTETINSIVISADSTLNTEFYFSVIDLTQMFGSGNEPSLSECESLFVADYYVYNTGTATSLNGLNSYAQGFNDAIGGFEWVSTNSNFVSALQSVNISNYYGVVSVYNSNYIRVDTTSSTKDIACFMPFNFVVPYGSTIKFVGSFSHNQGNGYLPLSFGYLDVNNNMQIITSTRISGGGQYPVNIQFTSPTNLSGVYIILGSDDTSSLSLFIYNAYFSLLTNDPYGAIQTAYDSGWENSKKYYDNYYGVNGTGYNTIYNAGYSAGLDADTPYTFGYLMSSVIEAPLNAVLSIFNFDFLGVNFKNVITLILTLCIIIAIVRLFMGGKE